MILITGATGQLGRATIDSLLNLKPDVKLAALARQPEKLGDLSAKGVEVRQGNYDDYNSLVKAFAGVDKLFFISASEIGKREPQHINVVNAAKAAGVKHIVYTSFQRSSESPDSPIAFVAHDHLVTEKLIKASGLTYTILRNALYLDVLPMFLGQKVLETGVFIPAGNGKTSFAARADMAKGAAKVLLSDNHVNKEYDFASGRSWNFQDIADILSKLSGIKVPYISPDHETYRQALTQAGVPAMLIDMTIGFGAGIQAGEFDHPSSDLQNIVGEELISPEKYLKDVLHL